ncbi:MAG: hypothetical protein AAGJ11_13215 [Bacteroidota bacterium]
MNRLLLGLALLAGPAVAQDAVTLTPGHPDLTAPPAPPENETIEVRMLEPQQQSMGTVLNTARLDGDVLTLVSRMEVQMAGPTVVDSTRLAWPSLVPLSHDSQQANTSSTVTYGDGRVEGSFDGGRGALPFDFDLESAVFPTSAIPLLALSIPYDIGYTATVPTFSAQSRFNDATLTVTGEEEVEVDGETVQAVVVEQRGGGGMTGRFAQRHYIDPEARELLYTMVDAPNNMVIRFESLTPEQVAAREAEMAAEAEAAEAAAAAADPIRPGSASLALDALASYEDNFALRLLQPQQMDAGTEVRTVTVDEGAGTVTIETVTDITLAGQRQESRAVLAYPSLAPISVYQTDGTDETELSFADGRVTGMNEGEAVDTTLDEPVFTNGSLPLVVRLLPLAEGYEAAFHGFSSSQGTVVTLLAVTGQETLGDRTAWVVTADRDDNPTLTFKIDAETRDLISYGLSPQPGVELEFGPAE